jgi:hypothetical protein
MVHLQGIDRKKALANESASAPENEKLLCSLASLAAVG